MPFPTRPQQADVSDAVLLRINDIREVIKLCISVSGLLDKQIYAGLDLEKAQFSRMVHGNSYFPAVKLQKLQEVCGNNLIQRWWALKTGFNLEPMLSTVEAENEALKAKNELLERDIETLTRFMQRTR